MKSSVEAVQVLGRKRPGVTSRFLLAALPLILADCVPAPMGAYYKPIYADPSATNSGDSCGGGAGAPASLSVELPQGVVLSVNAWHNHGERNQRDRPLHLSVAVPKGVELQFTSDEVRIGGDAGEPVRVIKPSLQISASVTVPMDAFVDFEKIAPTTFALSNGTRLETEFSGIAGLSFSLKEYFAPDEVTLELPGIEISGQPSAQHTPIALNASAKKPPDSHLGQYKSSKSLTYATKESQQELARRFEACSKDTPTLKCNQILQFDEARFSVEQEGFRYSGRMYVFDLENHSPFSADLTVKFSAPRTWRFATNTVRVVEASKNDIRSYRFKEFPLSFNYKVPLETRLAGVNNMPNSGNTKVGFSLNLGDKQASKYIIELPAVHINGVLYRVLPIELERRMFDVGIEPFNC